VVSAKCQADSTRAFSAITQRINARTTLMKLCNWEMNHLCSEVRTDPAKGLQCLLDSTQKATGICNSDISGGVIADAFGNEIAHDRSGAGRAGCTRRPRYAQTAIPAGDIIDKLAAADDTTPDVDVAALKQQAADRVKAKADAQPVKRPLIAPQLTKLTQLRFDILFDPDSSLIRPGSYAWSAVCRCAGRSEVAALQVPDRRSHRVGWPPRFQPGAEPAARGLDPGRAGVDLQISGKRLVALGLGEEQLQDANKPAAPAMPGPRSIAFGKPDVVEPKPAAPAAAKKAATPAKKKR